MARLPDLAAAETDPAAARAFHVPTKLLDMLDRHVKVIPSRISQIILDSDARPPSCWTCCWAGTSRWSKV